MNAQLAANGNQKRKTKRAPTAPPFARTSARSLAGVSRKPFSVALLTI